MGKSFMWINGVALLVLLAVTVWGAFDLHNRRPYVLIAQIPPVAMMVMRRWRKRGGGAH